MKGETTLKEIASLAGLSINTVSRALNNRSGVNEKTRSYIKELAEKYHYRPNMMARTMRGVQNTLLGTIVSDINDQFFVSLLSGIEEEATKASMPIIIGNTSEDMKKQNDCLELLLSYHCKNIIITPVQCNSYFVEMLRREDVHFVVLDRVLRDVTDINQVSINNLNDSYRAVEYMIKCGHRRIAIINQDSNIPTESDRTLGYMNALSDNGIPCNPAYVRLCPDAYSAGLASRALMELENPPTAIYLAKDRLALEAVSALYSLNKNIPDDVSIFIYGSPEWIQLMHLNITCMERPIQDIGRMAARILIDRLNGSRGSEPTNTILDSKLVIRDSVKMLL